MKPFIFTYSEGKEVKVLVATREKKQLKIEQLIRTEREVKVEETVEETEFAGMGLEALDDEEDVSLGKMEDVDETEEEDESGQDIAELSDWETIISKGGFTSDGFMIQTGKDNDDAIRFMNKKMRFMMIFLSELII